MRLAAAYEPFVETLLLGGFADPPDGGWTAEMVAAHVALNNECFTAAAWALIGGANPSYDNEVAVAPVAVREGVARVGGRPELAAWVRESARELEGAYDALSDEQRATPMPTVIRHEGVTVVDEPRPIGAMIEGNATVHLQMHLDQLRSLVASH